jgi:hypothetical protein
MSELQLQRFDLEVSGYLLRTHYTLYVNGKVEVPLQEAVLIYYLRCIRLLQLEKALSQI